MVIPSGAGGDSRGEASSYTDSLEWQILLSADPDNKILFTGSFSLRLYIICLQFLLIAWTLCYIWLHWVMNETWVALQIIPRAGQSAARCVKVGGTGVWRVVFHLSTQTTCLSLSAKILAYAFSVYQTRGHNVQDPNKLPTLYFSCRYLVHPGNSVT